MMSALIREIQAPVSDLCGLQSIMSEIPEGSSIYQYAKTMNTCGLLLADMIENMRMYYRLSADMYDLKMTSFNLRAELQGVWMSALDDHKRMSTWSGDSNRVGLVRCELSIGKDVPGGVITSDSMCALKIFKTLLSNALRFTIDGTINIGVHVEKREDVRLLFTVEDTGVGVPEGAEEAIFEPLTKAHAESIHGGVGMGLAVSRAMCEALGGELVLDGGTGIGSTFRASFPIKVDSWGKQFAYCDARVCAPNDNNVTTESGDMARKKRMMSATITDTGSGRGEMPCVLLVEDIRLNQIMVSRMMNDVNISVVIAEDGVEAVRECSVATFDLILMDITMPNMGGIEATEKIKAGTENKKTPVVALTGTLAGKMEKECLQKGMIDCLSKPVRRRDLVETVAKHLKPKHRAWMIGQT